MSDRDAMIRARAHAIWEAEGCPHGRDEQHWHQATLDVEQAEREGQAGEGQDAAVMAGKAVPTAVAKGRAAKGQGASAEAAAPARGRKGTKATATPASGAETAAGEASSKPSRPRTTSATAGKPRGGRKG